MAIEAQKTADGKVIVIVDRNLDRAESANELKKVLLKLYEEGEKEIILDLEQVKMINSNGVGKILMFYKRFSDAGGELYYLAPLKGLVKEIFDTLLLTSLLKEYRMEG